MTIYSDTLRDENARPIAGASVYVYTAAGVLAELDDTLGNPISNPVTSDDLGYYAFDTGEGRLTLDIFLGVNRVWKEVILLGDIPLEGLQSLLANTRAALAAYAGMANGQSATLTEAGREGLFVFDSSNLSALVTADPSQGIYVAPASAPTGASGAWARQFEGPVNPEWWGAVGDDDSIGSPTDNGAALAAMVTCLNALNSPGFGISKGVPGFRLPDLPFYAGSTTLDFTFTPVIEGVNPVGSALRWAAGTTGLRFQAHNTSGAGGAAAAQTYPGAWSAVIRNIRLKGAYSTAGVEGEFHGIHARVNVILDGVVYIEDFQGDGIYINVTAGGTPEGNANGWQINGRVYVSGCRNGLFTDGADSNAGTAVGLHCNNNRQWGIWDSSFLGNTYDGVHTTGNGFGGNGTTVATTFVSHSGNRFRLKPGQAAGAATNSPAATGIDNTWWIFWQAGGVVAGTFPAWFNGISVREGGAAKTDNPNASNVHTNGYHENDQPPVHFQGQTLVLGGQFGGLNPAGDGSVWQGHLGVTPEGKLFVPYDFRVGQTLYADGAIAAYFGPKTGSSDGIVFLESRGTLTNLIFRASEVEVGRLYTHSGFGLIANVPTGKSFFVNVNAATIATVDGAGMELAAGKAYRINALQVVGARKTGWSTDTGTAKRTANATYVPGAALTFGAAYVEAELDAMAARMVLVEDALRDATQTIKALKDDFHNTAGHGLIGT